MNELLFLFHSLLTFTFVFIAFRAGKEWLLATTVVLWIFANLFVLKQIELFGLTVTASDAFSVGGSLGIALLNEFYGMKYAKKAVWIGFYLLLIFAVMSWVQVAYIPSASDGAHHHYSAILEAVPRLVAASLVAYLASLIMNVYLSSFLQNVAKNKYMPLRTLFVVGVTQLFDTVLFTYLGLYGVLSSLFSIVVLSYIVKCVAIAISTPFVVYLSLKGKRPSQETLAN